MSQDALPSAGLDAGAATAAARATLAALPPGRGTVSMVVEDGVAQVIIDNAEARNALSVGMMLALGDIVDRLAAWDGAVVLLRSRDGRAFCAGGDLAAVRRHLLSDGLAAAMSHHMQATLDALRALPLVVCAALEGAAVGGGAELLTVADHVVAGSAARVGFVHARLGVSPGWGGARRLVDQVGPRRALALLSGARLVPADEARALGLVDAVVPAGTAHAAALAHCRAVAALPPEAIRAAVSLARGPSVDEERAAFLSLWGGPAHVAALARTPHGRP